MQGRSIRGVPAISNINNQNICIQWTIFHSAPRRDTYSDTKLSVRLPTLSPIGSRMEHVMIVYGGQSAIRSGLLDRVRKSLGDTGITVTELGGVKPNPTDDKVYDGIALGREADV